MVNEISEKLWIYLMVDLITKLPLVAGKNIILVVCDRLFKMAYFVTTMGRTLVEELVWKLHGLLESVILDRRPQFVVELTKKLNRMLEIKTKLSMSFYPQTDGQTEQTN